MQAIPEFLQGSITDDFEWLLNAAPVRLAGSDSAETENTGSECSGGIGCPPGTETGSECSRDISCQPDTKTGSECSSDNACPTKDDLCQPPKNASATFRPRVTGWSLPPTPPAF